jgi:hypothetical protein
MLMNTKKSNQHSSISPPSTVSVGLSNRLEPDSQPAEHFENEIISRIVPPEIEAAQQLLARISVRIVTQKRGTNEK